MKSENFFQKALLVLDKQRISDGEKLLRQAIAKSEEEKDQDILIKSSICLGDLLCETGRSKEGRCFLENALSFQNDIPYFEYEYAIARMLLSKMK